MKSLINLQTCKYEHPLDRATLQTLKKMPGVEPAVNFIMNWAFVKRQIIRMCGNSFHVTAETCPELSIHSNDVFRTLNLNFKPDVYVYQDYYINAYTTGHEKNAFIALSSGGIDRLSGSEIKFVIGHEAGHIKSGHVLYDILCANLGSLVSKVPLLSTGVKGALFKWYRMSEFTADRAGLLACQDLDASISAIMKMAGLPEKYYNDASLEGFKQQAREFQDKYGGTAEKLLKLYEIFDENHPWTVIRAAELINWVKTGEYQKILEESSGINCPVCGSSVTIDTSICPRCGYKFEK